MKLLLFDIDGTLLRAGGAGRAAFEAALQDVTGRAIDSDGLAFSGKTDPLIVDQLLEREGLDAQDGLAVRVLDAYAGELERRLAPGDARALPGVHALLQRLAAHPDVHLGLLTGNLECTAFCKLEATGLDGFFSTGAFGSDDADRDRLVPIAARRAEERTGHAFAARDVTIIGDTPRDIACGKAHDARTVAVCTGRYNRAALADANPAVLFDDLTDADGFVEAVV